MQTKRCTKCGETKPLDGFSPRGDGKGRDGRASQCKACRSKARAVVLKPCACCGGPKPRGGRRQLCDTCRAEISARKVAYALAWQKAHPEAVVQTHRRKAAKRRLRRQAAFIDDVDPLVVLERADGVCGICGEDVDPLRFQVDHIVPLSKGGEHSYRNTQPAHPVCNNRKGARAP